MKNQSYVHKFLEMHDAGESITTDIQNGLAKELRPGPRGQPKQKFSYLAVFALFELCTAELIIEYINLQDISSVNKYLKRARDEGWTVVNTATYLDESGQIVRCKKGRLSKGPSKQIWVDNGEKGYQFTFFLNEKNELALQYGPMLGVKHVI